MKNSQLKRKLLFSKNQSLIQAYKTFKVTQERLLVAMNIEIACIYRHEDVTRIEIARKDYGRILNTYINEYAYILEIKKEIEELQQWKAQD